MTKMLVGQEAFHGRGNRPGWLGSPLELEHARLLARERELKAEIARLSIDKTVEPDKLTSDRSVMDVNLPVEDEPAEQSDNLLDVDAAATRRLGEKALVGASQEV